MRYIGNKTKLLDEIEALLEAHGVRRGRMLDIFTGTGAVARRFRERGFEVFANDRMRASHVLARAALGPRVPVRRLAALLERLRAAPDEPGVIARRYSPRGREPRLFFTEANALRIDAALETLARWRTSGEATEAELYACLASVIDAADRVANISGTYGAFLKSWQSNALNALELRAPETPPGPLGRAFCEDANELARDVDCDVLYIDPPYNDREYAANYHVLEAVAARPFLDAAELAALEGSIYGKTGLRPYEKSAFCRPRHVEAAFRDLIAGCRAAHVVVSYSEEGLLSRAAIEGALRDGLGARDVDFRPVGYKRFRSDKDGASRRYKVLPGKARDEVHEWLFFASRPARRAAPTAASRAALARSSAARSARGAP